MLTNLGNISLPIAVWLAGDDYDLIPRENMISVTSLLKPMKSFVLSQRIATMIEEMVTDLQDIIPSRLGTAIHAAVEKSWKQNRYKACMLKLGYPQHIIDKIQINPNRINLDHNMYNIFIEIREEKIINGITISGKFDFVEDGRVKDIKTTGTYNWINAGNDVHYAMQGSLYKWLNPDIITQDVMDVEYIFTDWKALMARADKNYPQKRVMTRTLRLKSIPEIDHFVRMKLVQLSEQLKLKEVDMVRCTPEEVWQRPTKFAYYKNAQKLGRATKLFDSEMDAMNRLHQDGSIGLVQRRPGQVKFCTYCPARPICQQAEAYTQQGLLAN